MTPLTIVLAAGALAVVLTAAIVPVVRQLARGTGLYEQPVADRWHRRPVPKLGGVAMAIVFIAVAWWFADSAPLRALLVASLALGVLGLIDDFWPMRPLAKFSGQIAAAVLFLWFAPSIDLTGEPVVDTVVAFTWFVGITNAFNLLDNIDGAAAGIAAIAGAFFVTALMLNGASDLASLALVVAVLTGVALGFLIHNWHPASIFMGDSGSHLLGSFFAGATILAAPHMHENSEIGVAIGVVLLFVPCADTALVILTRQLAGRSAFVGGRDHLSHRIVALGLNERSAVLALYAMAIAGGFVALGLQNLDPALGWIPALSYGVIVAIIGVYLGHVDVRGPVDARVRRLPLPLELTLRHRAYEVLLDLALVGFAYYLGIALRFRNDPDINLFLGRFAAMLPLVILLHLIGLWMGGKYRKTPTSSRSSDMHAIVRGMAIGSALTVIAVLYITRFEGYSRQAFLIGAGLAVTFITSARFVVHAADDLLRRRVARGPLAVVYGAGRLGSLVIRQASGNEAIAFTPLAFIDDDERKWGKRVEGVRVIGPLADLERLITSAGDQITTVVLAIHGLPADRFDGLCAICNRHGVEIQQFHAAFKDVDIERRDRSGRVIRFPGA